MWRARTFTLGLSIAVTGARLEARPRPAEDQGAPVRLAWYTSLHFGVALKLAARFGELHPAIRVYVRRSSPLFERGDGQGADWEKVDVVTDTGIGSHHDLLRRGVFARLHLDAGSLRALCSRVQDPDGRYAITHTARIRLMFNRKAVSEQDASDSLADLARPRWKGKVALLAPSASQEADCLYRFVIDRPDLGFPWLEKMRDNEVMFLLSSREVEQAVSHGIRSEGWGTPGFGNDPARHTPKGSGLGARPAREGSAVLLYATAVSGRAPHPAAARLFVNWLLEPATQRYMVENGLSHDSLFKGDCGRLERDRICGLNLATDPKAAAELRRRVWETLLGERHISR